jgi:antitoxin Phd
MATWQLQAAKAHLSQVVREAVSEGPQYITHRGKSVAVLISKTEFEQLTQPTLSFVEFIRQSPLAGLNIDFTRDKSLTRDLEDL